MLIKREVLDAIKRGASDLHFEPYETKYRIRFRVDGILHEVATPPVNLANRFAARLKVMARLDIAERRRPQDGKIDFSEFGGKALELRVAIMPTHDGLEDVVLENNVFHRGPNTNTEFILMGRRMSSRGNTRADGGVPNINQFGNSYQLLPADWVGPFFTK